MIFFNILAIYNIQIYNIYEKIVKIVLEKIIAINFSLICDFILALAFLNNDFYYF